MIEAKELRVGNYVSINYQPKEQITVRVNSIDEIDGACIGGVDIVFKFEDLHPISLTEEWLLRFGFEKVRPIDSDRFEDGIWYNGFDLFQSWSDGSFNFATRVKSGELKSGYQVKYVHSLQNIFSAITNQELTIK